MCSLGNDQQAEVASSIKFGRVHVFGHGVEYDQATGTSPIRHVQFELSDMSNFRVCARLSLCVSVCLCVCLSVHLSVWVSVFVSFCLRALVIPSSYPLGMMHLTLP